MIIKEWDREYSNLVPSGSRLDLTIIREEQSTLIYTLDVKNNDEISCTNVSHPRTSSEKYGTTTSGLLMELFGNPRNMQDRDYDNGYVKFYKKAGSLAIGDNVWYRNLPKLDKGNTNRNDIIESDEELLRDEHDVFRYSTIQYLGVLCTVEFIKVPGVTITKADVKKAGIDESKIIVPKSGNISSMISESA